MSDKGLPGQKRGLLEVLELDVRLLKQQIEEAKRWLAANRADPGGAAGGHVPADQGRLQSEP